MVLRYTKPPTQRQLKISQSIRFALAEMFARGELSHPYFDNLMITVSEVRVSADLKTATAFIVLPDDSDKKSIIKFFNDISSEVRKLITPKINLKYSPTIRFIMDESIENAKKIEDIIKKG